MITIVLSDTKIILELHLSKELANHFRPKKGEIINNNKIRLDNKYIGYFYV